MLSGAIRRRGQAVPPEHRRHVHGTGQRRPSAVPRFHYAQLIDVNGDGRLDVLCPDEATFPQKIYDTRTTRGRKSLTVPIPRPSSRSSTTSSTRRSRISTTTGKWTSSSWAACKTAPPPWSRAARPRSRRCWPVGARVSNSYHGHRDFHDRLEQGLEGGGTDITKIQIGANAYPSERHHVHSRSLTIHLGHAPGSHLDVAIAAHADLATTRLPNAGRWRS